MAGVVEPPGPQDMADLADAVLSSTYTEDLAIALAVRGNAALARHDNDKAIEAYSAAHDADPPAGQEPGAAGRAPTARPLALVRVWILSTYSATPD